MDLSTLIPDNSDNWIVKNKFLMYRKYEHVPACFIENGIVYVFLDLKIYKSIIKLINHLMKNDLTFYLTTPELSNPSGIPDYHNTIIKYYLHQHAQEKFFHGFKKIGFDLIYNMVKWCEKENCFDLVKPNYEIVLKEVMSTRYDFYSNKNIPEFEEEIREEFQGLYRDIQINKIL